MSIDVNIYIGPFSFFKEKPKTVKINQFFCLNGECKNFQINFGENTGFCQKCGKELANIPKEEDFFEGALNILTENGYTDDLFVGDFDDDESLIPNLSKMFGRNILTDMWNEPNFIDLENINIKEEIEIFKEKYKKHFEILKEHSGENSIIFKWGLLKTYN